jgi:hypothetical protein
MNDQTITTDTGKIITFADVVKVYAGKPDHCCCGCAGKYTYASKHREEADGYKVSDVTVKRIFNRILRHTLPTPAGESTELNYPYYISLQTSTRLYIAYFE